MISEKATVYSILTSVKRRNARRNSAALSVAVLSFVMLALCQEVVAFVPVKARFAAAPSLPAVIDRQEKRHETDVMFLSMSAAPALEQPMRGGGGRRSFEDRMRDMVDGGRKRRQQQNRQEAKLPPNVKICRTLDEYKAVVGEERERLVATRFYAPWWYVSASGGTKTAADRGLAWKS